MRGQGVDPGKGQFRETGYRRAGRKPLLEFVEYEELHRRDDGGLGEEIVRAGNQREISRDGIARDRIIGAVKEMIQDKNIGTSGILAHARACATGTVRGAST